MLLYETIIILTNDTFCQVKTQVDPPMIISIQARRPPPVLSCKYTKQKPSLYM